MATENLERLTPDRRLSLDGEPVAPELSGRISRITVELSEDVFNECRIVFTDPDMSLISGQKLAAGVGVFVELGFQGKLKPVFEGEIVSIEPRFVRDHPPSIVVRALERLHRLALAPNTRSFTNVDAAEVVSIIAKENGLSGEGPKGSKGHLLQANQTDFQLLRKIAARTGNRISLQGKKLVVAPPPSLGEIECLPGEGLKKLKVKLRTTEQVPKVVVRGWDPKDKREIVGQATPQGEAGEGAKDAKPFGRTDFIIEGPLVTDMAEAEKIAKATMGFIAERFAVADGEILGNADVLPGKVLNFDKLGELLDGKYRVTTARHEFDKRGYRVAFSATRIAKKKSALKFKAPAPAPAPAKAAANGGAAAEGGDAATTPAANGTAGTGTGPAQGTTAAPGEGTGASANGGTNEGSGTTQDTTNADAAQKPSAADGKSIDSVAIEAGPKYCGQSAKVTGKSKGVASSAAATGHLWAASKSASEAFLALENVAIGGDGAISATAAIKDVHLAGASPTAEVKAHVEADGLAKDSDAALKVATIADFTNETFRTIPSHPTAPPFAPLNAKWAGSLAGGELKLKVRVKAKTGWRRWTVSVPDSSGASKPRWADRTASGWKTWNPDTSAWEAYTGPVNNASIREVVATKDSSGKIGVWLDAYYSHHLREHPANAADGQPLPNYTLGASDFSASISSTREAWDSRVYVKRKGCQGSAECCRWLVRVELVLGTNTSSPDYEITYVGASGGAGRANVNNWYDREEFLNDSTGTYGSPTAVRKFVHAHEVGHMMGAFDEYSGGGTGTGSELVIDANSIMGSAALSNIGSNSKVKPYMLRDAAEFLRQIVQAKHSALGWDFEVQAAGGN